jgi:hypothetical protein
MKGRAVVTSRLILGLVLVAKKSARLERIKNWEAMAYIIDRERQVNRHGVWRSIFRPICAVPAFHRTQSSPAKVNWYFRACLLSQAFNYTTMSKTIYFGYGSNFWLDQMKRRCPDSKFIGIGKLDDW